MRNMVFDILYGKEKRLDESNIDRFARRFFMDASIRKRKLENLENKSFPDRIEIEALQKSSYIVREIRYLCMLGNIENKDRFEKLVKCIILEHLHSVFMEAHIGNLEEETKAWQRCVCGLEKLVEESMSVM